MESWRYPGRRPQEDGGKTGPQGLPEAARCWRRHRKDSPTQPPEAAIPADALIFCCLQPSVCGNLSQQSQEMNTGFGLIPLKAGVGHGRMNPEDMGRAQSTRTELREVAEAPPALSILCQVTHRSREGAAVGPTGQLPRGRGCAQTGDLTHLAPVLLGSHQPSVLQVCCHPDRTTPGEQRGISSEDGSDWFRQG